MESRIKKYIGYPNIKLMFSGSSSVDIIKGTYDLSRRVSLLRLPVLSFREYLNFKYNLDIKSYSLQDLIDNNHNIPGNLLQKDIAILKEFKQYLDSGEFPFFLSSDDYNYKFKVDNIINKIVYEDISSFYKLKTQNYMFLKK